MSTMKTEIKFTLNGKQVKTTINILNSSHNLTETIINSSNSF